MDAHRGRSLVVYAAIALVGLGIGASVGTVHERSLRIQAEGQVTEMQAEVDVVEQAFETSKRELTTIEWCLSESTDPLGCVRFTVGAFMP